MREAGLEPWEQFFVNLRRTCINEKREQGHSQAERTAVFGNTPIVRAKNYDGDLTANDIASLGIEKTYGSVPVPATVPAVTAASGGADVPETSEVGVFHSGLPNHERDFPTFFPTFSSDSASVWEMVENGASRQEVIVAALLRIGYSAKAAWTIAEHDRYAPEFYRDLIYLRERVCEYRKQQISYVSLLGSAAMFCLKNLRRAWLGSIISQEMLSASNLDRMAGAGLEPATFTPQIQQRNANRQWCRVRIRSRFWTFPEN